MAQWTTSLTTGVVAIQNPGAEIRGWRVSATGFVLELEADLRVVKKLKLVGCPPPPHTHTPFSLCACMHVIMFARFVFFVCMCAPARNRVWSEAGS